MVSDKIVQIILVFFLIAGCSNQQEKESAKVLKKSNQEDQPVPFQRDLETIIKEGKLRAITKDRKAEVHFTDYLYLTHQVLVQKKPDNWRKMKWSAIERSLIKDAIEMVLNGDIKYTISDDNIASVFASYYPILDIDVPISFSQRIAWATRATSPDLSEAINTWLAQVKKDVYYYHIYNKYFKNSKDFRRRTKSEFYSLNNQKISKYDDIIKEKANLINWDWRLLAALVYQESRFEPKASSWAGAAGLMQLMPATATELGVKDRSDPGESLEGGSKYLNKLYGYFDSIPDRTQRIKFTMASYNCGYGHVRDAQRLATKNDLNPELWDDNVEKMILALSKSHMYKDPVVQHGYLRGHEPFNYVRQIFERYDHYQQFIEE